MVGAGNPASLLLRDWLAVLSAWSDTPANVGHAPVTLVLDIKSDLTDNDEGGDLEDLNQRLEDAFGAKLLTRADNAARGAWPSWTTCAVASSSSSPETAARASLIARPTVALRPWR